ncbi:TPA: hypothetical protein KOW24_001321 [Clostridioides difficile]|nr:hypothetical protein [Clostridioides difficile]
MSRTAICSVCGEFLVDSYGDKFTNAKVIDLYGREFVIVICKGCLEELLRKCEDEKRAMQVLDNIQRFIEGGTRTDSIDSYKVRSYRNRIFQMPIK